MDIHKSSPELTIGSASAQDFDSVLSLWQTAELSPSVSDTRAGLSGLIAFDRDALLLARRAGAVVGTLIAAWDGWRASFYRLTVHPDWRRRGIATALLRDGERQLLARGAVRFTAIVVEDDPTAIEFWRAAGYQRQQRRARFVRHLDDF